MNEFKIKNFPQSLEELIIEDLLCKGKPNSVIDVELYKEIGPPPTLSDFDIEAIDITESIKRWKRDNSKQNHEYVLRIISIPFSYLILGILFFGSLFDFLEASTFMQSSLFILSILLLIYSSAYSSAIHYSEKWNLLVNLDSIYPNLIKYISAIKEYQSRGKSIWQGEKYKPENRKKLSLNEYSDEIIQIFTLHGYQIKDIELPSELTKTRDYLIEKIVEKSGKRYIAVFVTNGFYQGSLKLSVLLNYHRDDQIKYGVVFPKDRFIYDKGVEKLPNEINGKKIIYFEDFIINSMIGKKFSDSEYFMETLIKEQMENYKRYIKEGRWESQRVI